MRLVFLISIGLSLYSCGEKGGKSDKMNADTIFNNYKARFVEDLWSTYPGWASSLGNHKYDSILVVIDNAFREKELAFTSRHLDSLKSFKVDDLSATNQADHYIITNALNSINWYIEEFRQYEWDPSYYNIGSGFGN